MWLLLLAIGLTSDEPADLVRRLGSGRYAEREAASRALEAIGEPALPALREGAHDRDLERRDRSLALLRRIEEGGPIGPEALARATPVRLGLIDQPFGEVLEAFNGALDGRVAWHPDVPDATRSGRATVREPGPVPFWTAIDRIARAGDLRVAPGSPGGPGDGRIPEFRLYLAPGAIAAPTADSGPFRLAIDRLTHARSVNLTPPIASGLTLFPTGRPGVEWGRPRPTVEVSARLMVEPRFLIVATGEPEVIEVTDSLGRPLADRDLASQVRTALRQGVPQAAVPVRFRIGRPDGSGPRIGRLRLTVPVTVLARRSGLVSIPLDRPPGTPATPRARVGTTSIEPIGVEIDPQGHTHVRLTLQADSGEPDLTPNNLDILDGDGRLFPWFGAARRPGDSGPGWLADLTLWPDGGIPVPEARGRSIVPPEGKRSAVPVEVRYHEMARVETSVTFEFRDLPLP